MQRILNNCIRFPARVAVALIEIYQHTLSPDHGLFKHYYPYGFCRFYPSCSEYSKQSIQKFGLIKGSMVSIVRIGKCNPWTKPQINLVKDC